MHTTYIGSCIRRALIAAILHPCGLVHGGSEIKGPTKESKRKQKLTFAHGLDVHGTTNDCRITRNFVHWNRFRKNMSVVVLAEMIQHKFEKGKLFLRLGARTAINVS